jgi:hypothetical protein
MENKTVETYFKKLNNCGVSEEACKKLQEKYGDILYLASYSNNNDVGLAYEGSMIDTSLKKLAVFAVKLNDIFPEQMRVDKASLVKVCLLQHISKAERFVKSNDEWRKTRLGELYSYTKGMPAIGIGLHSIAMATSCGVEFTTEEIEAMTIIDRKDDDAQIKYHSSLMSMIVRQANDMVYYYAKGVTEYNKSVENGKE